MGAMRVLGRTEKVRFGSRKVEDGVTWSRIAAHTRTKREKGIFGALALLSTRTTSFIPAEMFEGNSQILIVI